MLLPQMMHQFGKDLSVRVRLKLVTLLGQERLDVIVVGYDAIVNHHKAVALVGALWMRVALAGHTVGGPTGVCNPDVGEHRLAVLVPIEVCVCVCVQEENRLASQWGVRSGTSPSGFLRSWMASSSTLTLPVRFTITMSLLSGESMATPVES